jgi:hypothetical protein
LCNYNFSGIGVHFEFLKQLNNCKSCHDLGERCYFPSDVFSLTMNEAVLRAIKDSPTLSTYLWRLFIEIILINFSYWLSFLILIPLYRFFRWITLVCLGLYYIPLLIGRWLSLKWLGLWRQWDLDWLRSINDGWGLNSTLELF